MTKATVSVGGRRPPKRSTGDHYLIISDAYPVRISAYGLDAVSLNRDGTETPVDAYKAAIDGTDGACHGGRSAALLG